MKEAIVGDYVLIIKKFCFRKGVRISVPNFPINNNYQAGRASRHSRTAQVPPCRVPGRRLLENKQAGYEGRLVRREGGLFLTRQIITHDLWWIDSATGDWAAAMMDSFYYTYSATVNTRKASITSCLWVITSPGSNLPPENRSLVWVATVDETIRNWKPAGQICMLHRPPLRSNSWATDGFQSQVTSLKYSNSSMSHTLLKIISMGNPWLFSYLMHASPTKTIHFMFFVTFDN